MKEKTEIKGHLSQNSMCHVVTLAVQNHNLIEIIVKDVLADLFKAVLTRLSNLAIA